MVIELSVVNKSVLKSPEYLYLCSSCRYSGHLGLKSVKAKLSSLPCRIYILQMNTHRINASIITLHDAVFKYIWLNLHYDSTRSRAISKHALTRFHTSPHLIYTAYSIVLFWTFHYSVLCIVFVSFLLTDVKY